MNAGRKYLGPDNIAGKVYVTAGLGGMSGAQGKAIVIAGCIGVVAEVSLETDAIILHCDVRFNWTSHIVRLYFRLHISTH